MPRKAFDINITDEAVSVRLNAPSRTRFYASGFLIALPLGMCALPFVTGAHGAPNTWHGLTFSISESEAFTTPLSLILLSLPVLLFFLLKRYVVAAFPSDEALHCDRSTLTISKVRYLDIRNSHWDTHSYQLINVRDIRYRSIISTKDATIYGLRFIAAGQKQKILPGISPRYAKKILEALKALGADVPDDPTLQQKIKNNVPGQWP